MLCMIFDDYQAAFFVLLYEKKTFTKLEGNYYFQQIVTCIFSLITVQVHLLLCAFIYVYNSHATNLDIYTNLMFVFRYLWLHKTDVRYNFSIRLN